MRTIARASTRLLLPALLLSAAATYVGEVGAPSGPHAQAEPSVDGVLQKIKSFPTSEHGIRHPSGMVWNARLGALVLADEERPAVRRAVQPDETTLGRVPVTGGTGADGPVDVAGADGHDLRGRTTHPETRDLFTYDATAGRVLAIRGGAVNRIYDASDLDVEDPRGIALAPSADPTDHGSTLSVYVLDNGGPGEWGEVVEATFASDLDLVADVTPTSVRIVETSAYDPPSPDPSGVAYLPGVDRLFIADGEVDEMSIFEDANLFTAARSGTLTATGTSQPWSDEPVGVGYNPANNHLFVTDDDLKSLFELTTGADGRFGTADDGRTTTNVQSRGVQDPEGIDYDPGTNSLWFAGGEAADLHRVQAGGDGRFGTSDDVWSHWDAGIYGAEDPEGMAFDAARGTVLLLDDSSSKIYELTRDAALINTIDISPADMQAAAGLAVAPASDGSGARTYYVVARGEDNDSHPNENDGRLYEITASLPPIGGGPSNQAPVVDAGTDASVVLPASASLDGTVSDDGLPDDPGAVTTIWSKTSGPGDVTFGDPSAVDTTASFSQAGTYVLRLAASDGALTTADEVTVFVAPAGGAIATERRIATGSDDAEQSASGAVNLSSSDLELTTDGNTQQTIGLRFPDLQLPQGAQILRSYVQFTTDEVSTGPANLAIRAQAADNAATFASTSGNITSRSWSTSSASWTPPDWPTVGQAGTAQQTTDLSAVLQTVVDRAGWTLGNAVALQVTGTGRRTARAFESGATVAPLLRIEYTTGGTTPTNQPPTVDAGPDATVQLPAAASLNGTVNDDGLPSSPGALTTTWSRVSGPGTVTFGNAAATDTTATFSTAGTYVLRLTADDGQLSASDDVTITVTPASETNAPPTVNAGSDATVTLPASVSLDGTVTDDDLPSPPNLTTTWSKVSGPGDVTFASASAVDTTASFSTGGTYVLRLTASDGQLSAFDEMTVVAQTAGGGGETQVAELRVSSGDSDAEESVSSGKTLISSSDLELTTDGNTVQVVGIRIANIPVPAGATITSAHLQFTTDEVSTGPSSLAIRAEDADNAAAYTTAINAVTSRSTTAATVAWAPPDWTTVGQTGAAQQTPDLSALVQAVVSRTDWVPGNAIAFQVSGTGVRKARAFESGANLAPLLHIEYTTGGTTPTNQPPTVDAGPDATVQLPAGASLNGTVNDDGLPSSPGAVTTTWSRVSGPGTVTFGNAAATDTTATFSAAGTYVLRLTADDGQLSASDDVTINVEPASSTNAAPTVSAGLDATVQLPTAASLNGTVNDDGLPNPPGAVTTTWSKVSGPGDVTFASASSVDTTASFSTAGTYVLRLTASDGQLSSSDDVTVQVEPASTGDTTTVEKRVVAGSDDAEQRTTGATDVGSSDLELTTDGSRQQIIGLRFTALAIPAGATITSAYVQFTADEVSTGASSMAIRAEAVDNAPTYTKTSNSVTSRATTAASVPWSPPDWPTVNAATTAQRTPDLSSLVQAVVSRPGWQGGNALALQISGTGRRTADAFDGGAAVAPLLHVEFTGGSSGPINQRPTVDAGPNRGITLPSSASLDGTVTDDGLPSPTNLTTTWSKVSGPGDVTFASASSVDTTASFSTGGTYVLRLTASDGQLSAFDEMTVVAQTAGGGGETQVAELRVSSGDSDAEESVSSGKTLISSSDLELTTDGNTVQVVGIRIANIPVPAGATITSAHLQFTTDEVSTGASSLAIRAEDADNAAAYTTAINAVTSRSTTAASVAWAPPDWTTVGQTGAAQQTPDLSALVQAVVSRTDWVPGNAIAFQVSGTGVRKARAFESGATVAPLLHIEYTTG